MGCLVAKLRWLLFILGLGLTLLARDETRLAWRCAAVPEPVSLEALERGERPANEHVRIGPHLAILDGGAFHYLLPKGKKKEDVPLTDETEIHTLFYPVVSAQHPLARGADPRQQAYAVLIKSGDYGTLGEVRQLIGDTGFLRQQELTGVIINVIEPLSEEDKGLLRESFPQVDVASVVVIHAHRQPMSRTRALAYLLAAVALVFGTAGSWLYGLVRTRRDDAALKARPSLAPIGSAPSPYSRPPALLSTPLQPSSRPESGAPPSHAFAAGDRVRVKRTGGAVFGSVAKVQPGQLYVELDSGPRVWVDARTVERA